MGSGDFITALPRLSSLHPLLHCTSTSIRPHSRHVLKSKFEENAPGKWQASSGDRRDSNGRLTAKYPIRTGDKSQNFQGHHRVRRCCILVTIHILPSAPCSISATRAKLESRLKANQQPVVQQVAQVFTDRKAAVVAQRTRKEIKTDIGDNLLAARTLHDGVRVGESITHAGTLLNLSRCTRPHLRWRD